MLSPEKFVDLVEEMRAYQKLYFRDRDQFVLQQAKELEKLVDYNIGSFKSKQQELDLEDNND